jgi:hypothetical protein
MRLGSLIRKEGDGDRIASDSPAGQQGLFDAWGRGRVATPEQVSVWVGLDVGKETHFADVLENDGERLFARGIGNDQDDSKLVCSALPALSPAAHHASFSRLLPAIDLMAIHQVLPAIQTTQKTRAVSSPGAGISSTELDSHGTWHELLLTALAIPCREAAQAVVTTIQPTKTR